MTEADAIADRIAIMSHGRLRIYGSALYLKSVCGVGYNLIFKLDCKYCNGDDIKSQIEIIGEAIRQFIPKAVLFDENSVYALIDKHKNQIDAISSIEVVYKTAIQDSSKFPQLFEYMDEHLQKLRILHYAVSITTLEEVFLKIAGDDDIYSEPKIEELHTGTNAQAIMSTFDYNEVTKQQHHFSDPEIESPFKQKTKYLPVTTSNKPSANMEEFNIDQDTIDALCKFQRPSISSCQLSDYNHPFTEIFIKIYTGVEGFTLRV